ncbi:MAG: hypothetical protein JNJ90_03825 [Saprospiraceae bacterium]|jgi:hypothetical protein|nr:hypothetical protein [Saprospiraceae bacterium]
MSRFVIFLLFNLCFLGVLPAQPGCTDPQAGNYDPGATSNDGSCTYPTTNYSLTVETNLSTTLNETSGLVVAGGVVWTHNDSGNQPRIYKIDTLTNNILQTVTIGGATNVDWEDIASDGTNLYVGDFGNNANGNRTDLKIYKFPLSAIPSGANVTVPAGQVQIIHFSYEDQTDFTPQGSNNTSFDCESIFYHNGMLHLFTKDYINQTSTHYGLPTVAGTHVAENLETYDVGGLITAADISALGVIVLLGYGPGNGPLFFWLLFDYQPGAYFSGNKRRIELGAHTGSGKVEGIAFRNNAYGYVSNERITIGAITVPARLYSFSVSQWLKPVFFPVELVRFAAQPTGNAVLLEWETATESNNRGFVVEWSDDGVQFQEIGFVPGAGNSQSTLLYRFEDFRKADKVYYYRLRQQDFDGSEHLSQVVAVFRSKSTDCPAIFPNLLSVGDPIVLPEGLPGHAEVSFFDLLGQIRWQGERSNWNLKAPERGIFGLQIRGSEITRQCFSWIVVR